MIVLPLGCSGFLFEDVINPRIGGAAGFLLGLIVWHLARAGDAASRGRPVH